MKHPNLPPDDSWESDAVWNLIDRAEPIAASPSFADQVVRMTRQMPEVPEPWWKRLFASAPLTVFAGAVAAVAIGITFFSQPAAITGIPVAAIEPSSQADDFDALQDLAETETLIAATEHLDDFSDQELASLIGL